MAWIFNPFTANFDFYTTSGSTPTTNNLLLEDGFYLLLETGDKLILE